VWSVLRKAGIDPSPRLTGPSWAEFLSVQAKGIVACDFFTVDTVFMRRYVLVFVEHATRKMHLAGISAQPSGHWVTQRAREISSRFAGFRFLVRDRDTKVTSAFDTVFSSDGIQIVRTPPMATRGPVGAENSIAVQAALSYSYS
jgi:hypothetical protein